MQPHYQNKKKKCTQRFVNLRLPVLTFIGQHLLVRVLQEYGP